jgi:hypothetical protein
LAGFAWRRRDERLDVLVDHEFADASKGAIGQIIATSRRSTLTLPSEPMQH